MPLSVTLSNLVDDGAVFYLNGAEIKRVRMNDGAVTYTNLANGSPASGDASAWDVFGIPPSSLRPGTNFLAVEVHQVAANSDDVVFGSSLWIEAQRPPIIQNQPEARVVRPGEPASMTVQADGSPALQYQWRRNGTALPGATLPTLDFAAVTPDHVGSYSVLVSNRVGSVLSLPAALTFDPLAPPALISASFDSTFSTITLAFHKPITPETVTNLANFLVTSPSGLPVTLLGATLLNGTNVSLSVDPQTPGDFTASVAWLRDADGQSIARGSAMRVGQRWPLVPINARWKFDQRGLDLGSGWRDPQYDDTTWPSGFALLSRNTATLPEPVRTALSAKGGRITYYFRTRFDLPGLPTHATLQLSQIADDGVVFYLNGEELSRTRMPTASPSFDTLGEPQPAKPTPYEGPWALPTTLLRAGSNLLAAEVHQSGMFLSDMAFGASLDLVVESAYLEPALPQLSLQPSGAAQATLWWKGAPGELEQSNAVEGPWQPSLVQANPQTVPFQDARFFRLR